MKPLFDSPYKVAIQMMLLLTVLLFFATYVNLSETAHVLLGVLLYAVVLLTLLLGSISGLIASLFILFFIGSILILMGLRIETFGALPYGVVTYEMFIVFGVVLISSVMLAGFIQRTVHLLYTDRVRLQSEMELFVATDQETSFDNKKRMKIEVGREISRVQRHKGHFTLLLLELDHYEEFLQVYGKAEVRHLLEAIGKKTNGLLRTTDRKFRFEENRFALLFTDTKKENVETILEKLAPILQKHQLLSGKYVTLTYHISFEEFNAGNNALTYEEFVGDLERELVFYAL